MPPPCLTQALAWRGVLVWLGPFECTVNLQTQLHVSYASPALSFVDPCTSAAASVPASTYSPDPLVDSAAGTSVKLSSC